MYLPEIFKEEDKKEIDAIIDRNSLATVVALTENGLTAHHLPLLREAEDRLAGHIALANDLHRQLQDGTEILAIFRGEEAYISPNWYPSKAEHHRHVPTWNYQAVHVAGSIHFLTDDKSKRAIVGQLTKKHEIQENGEAAWRMADAPADFMTDMLENIVGFRINITQISAKSKLSQNRAAEDFKSVANKLEAAGKKALSARMKAIDDARCR